MRAATWPMRPTSSGTNPAETSWPTAASFVRALSKQRLIASSRLVIRAVALGSGLPLFSDLTAPLPLTLVSATTYPDSTAIHSPGLAGPSVR